MVHKRRKKIEKGLKTESMVSPSAVPRQLLGAQHHRLGSQHRLTATTPTRHNHRIFVTEKAASTIAAPLTCSVAHADGPPPPMGLCPAHGPLPRIWALPRGSPRRAPAPRFPPMGVYPALRPSRAGRPDEPPPPGNSQHRRLVIHSLDLYSTARSNVTPLLATSALRQALALRGKRPYILLRIVGDAGASQRPARLLFRNEVLSVV
ncbi:hypothetical protein BD626DRAFT_215329 [Schizophyllum amplum]|uniref:Uncharacterized protein n=1 Tax=Schizophyllum amplum TaxID=97359 RepID=A0A550CKB7_9AGAR|nr:hypothetical protein BD626DRAFT_215329 [Auriculariopsis ampla]